MELGISVLFAAHVGPGMAVGLYDRALLYDKAAHLLGTAMATRVVGGAVLRRFGAVSSRRLSCWICATTGATPGVFWEVFEFAVDSASLPLASAQRGLADTMFDLIANLGGALLGALSATAVAAHRKPRVPALPGARWCPTATPPQLTVGGPLSEE